MSHTTALRGVAIRSTTALRSAVAKLQQQGVACELLENTKPRMYYNDQHGKCDFVLNLKGCPYDVGFDKQEDGSYAPVFDEWAGHVGKQLGATCPMPTTPEGKAQHQIGKFMQNYTEAATIEAAVAQGYMVSGSTVDQDGNVHLQLTGM